jgi:hypothetical protein
MDLEFQSPTGEVLAPPLRVFRMVFPAGAAAHVAAHTLGTGKLSFIHGDRRVFPGHMLTPPKEGKVIPIVVVAADHAPKTVEQALHEYKSWKWRGETGASEAHLQDTHGQCVHVLFDHVTIFFENSVFLDRTDHRLLLKMIGVTSVVNNLKHTKTIKAPPGAESGTTVVCYFSRARRSARGEAYALTQWHA